MKIPSVNSSKFAILGAIFLAVIAVSGCIGGGSQSGTVFGMGQDALDLTFESTRDTVDSLEPFLLTLKATNIGEYDAESVQARLTGYDGIYTSSDEPLSTLKSVSSKISAPNMELDLPGDTRDIQWDVFAPYLSKELPDQEIDITAEILYDYRSRASISMVGVTREYLDSLETRGEVLPTQPVLNALNGPISIDVIVPDPHVEIIDDEAEARINIYLYNDGTGNIFNRERDEYDMLTKITLALPDGLTIDTDNCDFELIGENEPGSPKSLVIDNEHNKNKLRMLAGATERTLSCTTFIHRDYAGGGYQTFSIDVSAYYTYLQAATQKIIVHGTEEAPVSVEIEDPLRSTPDTWIRGTQNTIQFELLYNNRPVTTALSKNMVELFVSSTSAGSPVALSYNEDDEVWEATVPCPDMGNSDNEYDLKIEVEYMGSTVTDRQTDAVDYTPF